MKITKERLKMLIKEELSKVLKEEDSGNLDAIRVGDFVEIATNDRNQTTVNKVGKTHEFDMRLGMGTKRRMLVQVREIAVPGSADQDEIAVQDHGIEL